MAVLTVYPSLDGHVSRGADLSSWADLIAGTGTTANFTNIYSIGISNMQASATTDLFSSIMRGFLRFNTSALTSDAVISSVVFSGFYWVKFDALNVKPSVGIYNVSSAIVGSTIDYSKAGSTKLSDDVTYDGFVAGYNNWTFNSDGRLAINKTGNTEFCTRETKYEMTGTPPTWSASNASGLSIKPSEATGTTEDPKLVITYELSGSGVNYSITAEVGSFTLSGKDASLRSTRIIVAEAGNFVLTGIDVNLKQSVGVTLLAETGNFILSLKNANLITDITKKIELTSGQSVLLNWDAADDEWQ